MSNEWDDAAVGWDDDEAVRSFTAAAHTSLLAVLARADKSLDGAKVHDFGCGTGLLTERLAAVCRSIDAVDTSQAMLAVLDAKVQSRGWTHVMTRNALPTEPESYDLVVCSSVCSFLDDYPATLADLAILLVPGGLFVQWDWERVDNDDDPHGLSRDEISQALGAAGLTSTTVDTAFELAIGEMTMRPLVGTGVRPEA